MDEAKRIRSHEVKVIAEGGYGPQGNVVKYLKRPLVKKSCRHGTKGMRKQK